MDSVDPHTESVNSDHAESDQAVGESTVTGDSDHPLPAVKEPAVEEREPSGGQPNPVPGSFFDEVQPLTIREIPRARIRRSYAYRRPFRLTIIGNSFALLLFFTALLILTATGFIANFLITQHPPHVLASWLTIFGGVGICIGMFWLARFMAMKKYEARELTLSKADEVGHIPTDGKPAPGKQAGAIGEDARDRNQRRIEEYNEIAWSQARGSYRNSQIAMSIGLALLIAGVVTTVRQSQPSAQLVVGGLTGLGSAVSAYLGATFIRIYNEAINQMNYYYGQPLVTSYLLEAERMSKELKRTDTRDKVMERVIDATLAGAAEAGEALSPNAGRDRSGKSKSGTKPEPNTVKD
jgi:hypothetical protein